MQGTAPHSSTLAWKIPWMEEPGRLQSMGSLRVRHDWETSLSLFTFMHWRRKWQPTPVFLPGEPQGRGSLVGCHLWGRTELDTTEATCSSSSKHLIDFFFEVIFHSDSCPMLGNRNIRKKCRRKTFLSLDAATSAKESRYICQFSSVQSLCPSDSLRPHRLQHAIC